jgi:tetratricopeptide (TPR) repeat protein
MSSSRKSRHVRNPEANGQNQSARTTIAKAVTLHKLGNYRDALDQYAEVLRTHPNHYDAIQLTGAILLDQGDYEGAIAKFDKALKIKMHDLVLSNKGLSLHMTGDLPKALGCFNAALALNPVNVEALYNRGNTLNALGRFDEAIKSFEQVIRISRNHFRAFTNLGNALLALQRHEDALSCYERALQIEPNCPDALNGRSLILQMLGEYRDALSGYEKALALRPHHAESLGNRGLLYVELGRFAEGLRDYQLALEIGPNNPKINWQYAWLSLLLGEFKAGWRRYEYRWEGAPELVGRKRDFKNSTWLGQDSLVDKVIFIHAEQGLGDTIQFCRYLFLLKKYGARVVFEVQPALLSLLKGFEGADLLISKGSVIPDFDYHSPLLSLPFAFKTDLDSIPFSTPYLFPEVSRVDFWKKRLGNEGFKIGICWKASRGERTIPIEFFYSLLGTSGVRLISLHREDDNNELSDSVDGERIERLGKSYDADAPFVDAAAVISCCDLVITTDTSVAHLAGAIGAPTWVVLKYSPDFRWLLNRDDSPWYKSVRLFRQASLGDWKSAFENIKFNLKKYMALS